MTRVTSLEQQQLARSARYLRDLGLNPVTDLLTVRVLAECPSCWASRKDPDGYYRPLAVLCANGKPQLSCQSGCSDMAIRRELRQVARNVAA